MKWNSAPQPSPQCEIMTHYVIDDGLSSLFKEGKPFAVGAESRLRRKVEVLDWWSVVCSTVEQKDRGKRKTERGKC